MPNKPKTEVTASLLLITHGCPTPVTATLNLRRSFLDLSTIYLPLFKLSSFSTLQNLQFFIATSYLKSLAFEINPKHNHSALHYKDKCFQNS